MDIPDAPLCVICQHPLIVEGSGRAPSLGWSVHVGCYRDFIARHSMTLPPLEDVRWRVGEQVAFVADGVVRRGVIVALAGPMVRVEVGRDQALVLVEAGVVWPAR